jgi:hypothetical protein
VLVAGASVSARRYSPAATRDRSRWFGVSILSFSTKRSQHVGFNYNVSECAELLSKSAELFSIATVAQDSIELSLEAQFPFISHIMQSYSTSHSFKSAEYVLLSLF